ncbi:hypothetical protein FJK98_02240 [Micromonospora sp. HM134]|uniref:hypothetical protein n=1 Tax=Micromonospora sp. HM134 TaxID=2583243 RepID=UPI0011983B54|nr:hypothetical protein [Micromonospora sp. HM134]QDY06124.1 hypothetical protein FJK98_02240 [Micromonospora sp. HM134]
MSRRARLRWLIATWWERLVPGQCWTGVAGWALRDYRTPWSPIGEGCRDDLARVGTCYCGKLRAVEDTRQARVDRAVTVAIRAAVAVSVLLLAALVWAVTR